MSELDRIVASTREELSRRKHAVPAPELERAASERSGGGGAFEAALRHPGLSLIAEHKRRSPSAGAIRAAAVLEDVVLAYERGGAAALSVLTEGESFGGSLEDLRGARACSRLPILRKDFIVDPYQVDEALLAGADAVLLIVAALDDGELRELVARADRRGLSALIEVHDQHELERALECGAAIVGVNSRDLRTLEVDTARTFELLPQVPAGTLTVAESGFGRPQQLRALRDAGADAVLIGEALMRARDIERATKELLSAL